MDRLRIQIADLLAFLRSTPPAANIFALASLALWIVKVLVLDDMPGLFPGAYELGKVVEGVISAVIAGWVFYLFFALLPEARQKRLISPFVLQNVATIVGDTNGILQEIAKAGGEHLSFSRASEQRVARAFKKIPFNSNTTMLMDLSGRHATWIEFFRMRRERTRERIAEIKEVSRYVEPELTAKILSIGHNGFFTMSETTERYSVRNIDLGNFSAEFYKYLSECRELAVWHDANLVPPREPILPSLG